MTNDPRVDVVAQQYRKWQYPEPIHNLETWLSNNWQWFDPSHAHRLFWPDRDYQPGLDILVAGCGTNQGAVIAYTNPTARVVAIDVSEPSLDHHRFLKDKYALKNLELHCLPIEEVDVLDRDYDLVISTGVLHHLADPKRGLQALGERLRPEGVAAIMVYARYGRIGVEMLQATFRDLGLRQDETSLALVKAGIASLSQDHPLQSYLAIAPDLQFDAGLVDTFLHGRDQSFTVADCLDLVATSGLIFQDWFLKSSYYPVMTSGTPFLAAVAEMPQERQWSVMERINHRNGCHFFTACRPERRPETYRVDFATPGWLDVVPAFRYRCRLEGETISRPGWRHKLDPAQSALVRLVDGHRTIRDIASTAAGQDVLARRVEIKPEDLGRSIFRTLWQGDFLVMCLGGNRSKAHSQSVAGTAANSTATLDARPNTGSTSVVQNDRLRPALVRRLLGRAVASGQIRLPAVPAMLDDYQTLCEGTFAALGVAFSAEQAARLREVLADQLAVAWSASPRSEILVTWESPVGPTVHYHVKPQWTEIGAAYDAWIATREPPHFGAHPDARVWTLASEATAPTDCPVLDVGAGTGRNALALARRGHPVDAIELSGRFAAILRAEAAKAALPVRVLERDVFATHVDLRRDYGLVVASEVVSDFRSAAELRHLLELAADCLAPGGRLVCNVFLAGDGYAPDAAALAFGQQVYTSIFTRAELADAAAGLPLEFVSDDSVFDYEQQNLPEGAWPPTGWFANWVSGLDVFDVRREASPIEMRWLVWRKQGAP